MRDATCLEKLQSCHCRPQNLAQKLGLRPDPHGLRERRAWGGGAYHEVPGFLRGDLDRSVRQGREQFLGFGSGERAENPGAWGTA